MSLSAAAKLLWLFLLDHCDNAGVIEPNTKLAAFQIGQPIEEKHYAELGDRIKPLPNGKLLIPKFIRFQFGTLSKESRVHGSIFKLLDLHGIAYQYPIDTLSIGSVKGTDTLQDKDKDKDKDKESEGGVGGNQPVELPSGFPARVEDARCHAAFIGCPETFADLVWNKAMSRGGRDAKEVPVRSFRNYLATEWTYKQARKVETVNGAVRATATPWNIQQVITAKEKLAADLKFKHCSEVATGMQWDSETHRREFQAVRAEIKTLNGQMAALA